MLLLFMMNIPPVAILANSITLARMDLAMRIIAVAHAAIVVFVLFLRVKMVRTCGCMLSNVDASIVVKLATASDRPPLEELLPVNLRLFASTTPPFNRG